MPIGAGIAAGSTKLISILGAAAASGELITPENSTAKLNASNAAAAHVSCEDAVPGNTGARESARERDVGRELLPKTSAELDEQQHRDGAERREQRHVGVMQQLLPGREHRGDDDCRPHRAVHGWCRDLARAPAGAPSRAALAAPSCLNLLRF